MADTGTPTLHSYRRAFASYAVLLLVPAAGFGLTVAALVGNRGQLSLASAVGGLAGLAVSLLLPTRRQRRAVNQRAFDQMAPDERQRWERAFHRGGWVRTILVLGLPLAYVAAVLVFGMATWPWRAVSVGDHLAAAALSLATTLTGTWAVQWALVAWAARDRRQRSSTGFS